MGAFDGVRLDILVRVIPIRGREADAAEDAVYMLDCSTRQPLTALPIITFADVACKYGLLTEGGKVIDPRLSGDAC